MCSIDKASKPNIKRVTAIMLITLILFYLLDPIRLFNAYHLEPGRHYVCQTFNGRLGNHLYQYASIYGIAKLHNLTIILGEDDDLVEYFQVPSAEVFGNRKSCENFVEKLANHCCVFDETFMNLPNYQNYKLGVYLQSWKYFQHVFDEVRNELTFKKEIKEPAEQIVNNYRKECTIKYKRSVTIVGVHIRQGDIASKSFKLGGVVLVPDSYVRNAVDYFLQKFDNIVFIVCSDNISHAKHVMQYRNVSALFVHHSQPIYDLAVLSSCDHVLTTSGTFGWWAGFLSRGTVTYYKYPMKEGTFERSEYNYDDFFPRDWIALA